MGENLGGKFIKKLTILVGGDRVLEGDKREMNIFEVYKRELEGSQLRIDSRDGAINERDKIEAEMELFEPLVGRNSGGFEELKLSNVLDLFDEE